MIFCFFACSEKSKSPTGSDKNPQDEEEPEPDPGSDTNPTPALFAGFDFEFSQGSYWQYCWTYKSTSFVQGSTPTSGTDAGTFTITLGAPIVIDSVDFYRIEVSGKSSDPKWDYTPRWLYIGINGSRILGSTDGLTSHVIVDAHDGKWKGGGFFATFSEDTDMELKEGEISNEFIQTTTLSTYRVAGQSLCENIGGYTICPNDEEFTYREAEYYKGGLGPVGYYLYLGYSSSGGGFFTSFSYERNVGLVATSLSATDGFVPTQPPWTEKSPMPTARYNLASAVVNDKIYVMGGQGESGQIFDVVEIYDPAGDSWSTGSPMPAPRAGHTCTAVDSKIYVIGGYSDGGTHNTVWEYEPQSGVWARKADSPEEPRSGHVSAAVDGYIFMFASGAKLAYAYTALTDRWYFTTLIPNTESGRTGCTLGDKIFLFGGYEGSILGDKYRKTCLQFDPYVELGSPQSYIYKASMPHARNEAVSTELDGKAYIFGGFDGNEHLRIVDVYDPVSDSWESKSSMPSPNSQSTAAAVNGRIYVIGGTWGGPQSAVLEYDPSRD